MMGVRATGRQSFKQEALGVFCIGTMVDVLKHWETTESVEGVELVSACVCVCVCAYLRGQPLLFHLRLKSESETQMNHITE